MKTKVIFEESDFDGLGQILVRGSFSSNRAYKSCYGWFPAKEGNKRLYFLVAMTDGMATHVHETMSEFVDSLNEDGDWRPATQEELEIITRDQKNRFVF